jgi:ABC-2 type transport system permease protein
MSPRRSLALAGHELRLMRHEIGTLSTLVLLPLVMVAFLNPVFQATLAAQGRSAGGAAVAVPGMAVLFSLFLIGHVGYLFFREHSFGTWERLRATPMSPADVIVGKALPAVLLAVLQQVALFGLGLWLFDLQVTGSMAALLAVAVALAVCLVCFGVAAAAWLRSARRLNALSGVLAMVLGGLGGSLTPVESLPGWAQQVAPVSPGYWAINGYRSVVLDAGQLADVAGAAGMLLLFAVTAAGLAAARFRFEETKVGFE